RQFIQNFLEVCNISICYEPWYCSDTITLRMKYKLGGMSPISHANNNIGFKPAVIPFFFLCRFKMSGVTLNSQFPEASVKQISLGSESTGRRRVIIKN